MVQQKWLWIIGQFFSFILLAANVWYFERRTNELEAQVKECQSQKIELLTTAIDHNSQVLLDLKNTISKR